MKLVAYRRGRSGENGGVVLWGSARVHNGGVGIQKIVTLYDVVVEELFPACMDGGVSS